MVMVGWCTGAKSVLRRLLCLQCATVVHPDQSYASEQILCLMHCAWILSATDVLVHMLMKGAAKCNNHCELQNSVNQLTIERRSALGAFLRACLCQCFHDFMVNVHFWIMMIVHQTQSLMHQVWLPQCVELAAWHCSAHSCRVKRMNMTASKATCWI